jgi:16S rRNA (guanine1207-N2)-methyltransferase
MERNFGHLTNSFVQASPAPGESLTFVNSEHFSLRRGRVTPSFSRPVNPALETLLLAFGNEGLAVPKRALFLGAEPHPALKDWPDVTGWQPFKPKATAWEAAGFHRVDEPKGTFPCVLILPGKSRDETFALFARAYDLLENGGTLVAAMPNTAGAARFEKELAKTAGAISSIQKHKCRAFHAVKNDGWNLATLAEWRVAGERKPVSGSDLVAEAGMFSPDHIDSASALLAKHLPGNLRGKVADLGAGWGFLSHEIASRFSSVERLDLFEADARALDCAKQNLAAFPEVARFHWHDVAAGLGEVGYDAIVMNPPFHTGQNTDVGLGKAFIHAASNALKRGGRLFLVANRQLPYEAELTAAGFAWRKPAEDATFKVLFADKR